MKRRIALLSAVAVVVFFLCVWLLTGGRGNTASCERVLNDSDVYSEQDIVQAMDLVEDTFRSEFTGCYLIKLAYDDELSMRYCEEWEAQYDADQAMVLTSVFDVGESGGDGSLNPNSTYSNWQWILTRTAGEPWVLQAWGY